MTANKRDAVTVCFNSYNHEFLSFISKLEATRTRVCQAISGISWISQHKRFFEKKMHHMSACLKRNEIHGYK